MKRSELINSDESFILSWPDKNRGVKYLALIKEDHTFTFKTTEQRHGRTEDGKVFDLNPNLPYGPEIK
jgi:hypothetical protein